MSREVLIRFGTRNLDKAAAAARAIQKNVREALKQVKDVKRRKEMMRIAREEQREDRRILKEERERARANQRAQRLAERSRRQSIGGGPKFGDPDESIIAFLEGRGGARAVDMVARSLSALPILGEALSSLWEEFGRPFLKAQFDATEREKIQPLLLRLERLERDSLERKLREDAPFREMLARQELDRAINQPGGGKRWAKSSRLRGLD